ncbi:hypothetical protein sos41_24640 [Alphaproteobacteria bacterium SO-S41]|nr:hypothetical protein sos41_24640 [Alphaproteobacteria bacterium SO-S41]
MQDCRANALSTTSSDAVAALDAATAELNAFHGDPVGTIVAALKDQPDFVMGHVFLATVFATSMDRTFDGYMDRALSAAEALTANANPRERAYIAAARRWRSDDFEGATEAWGEIAVDSPRDIFAIQMAQQGDFFLGRSLMLRDRIARVLPHWDESVPGYGFVLGMQAFGLEECGDYRRAEAVGREAVSRNPQDSWGTHAVAHVLEMEGRAEEGAQWLRGTEPDWTENGLLACHNAWHLALAELESGNPAGALATYDRGILTLGLTQALQLCDASALLWRLSALGHDVGDRWGAVADAWEPRAEQGLYAFNDMHAVMAFASTGRDAAITRLLRAMETAARAPLVNALMTREVGLATVHGIAAFADRNYATALAHLMPVLPKLSLSGGSHAQRDVFHWTATEAALRAGNRPLATALAAERRASRPHSPINRGFAARAAQLPA